MVREFAYYLKFWHPEDLTKGARNLTGLIRLMRAAADTLDDLAAKGVTLDGPVKAADDFITLKATDRQAAEEMGYTFMVPWNPYMRDVD